MVKEKNDMRKYTDEELLIELERLTTQLGRIPKQKDFKANSHISVNAYKRAFKGIVPALELIGRLNKKIITEEECLEDIKRLYKQLGKVPTIDDIIKFGNISYYRLRNILSHKPWHIIIEKIGAPPEEIGDIKKRNISKEDLKNEIIRLKKKLGRYPTYNEMTNEGKFSTTTYSDKFGSWSKALYALGFDDYVPQSVFKKQIHVRGKDGIIYKSKFEERIANVLFDYKNKNLIDYYEYEKRVCEHRTWTCDFFVVNKERTIWIECDGMANRRKNPYDENNEKIKYYIANNLVYYILPYKKTIDISFVL